MKLYGLDQIIYFSTRTKRLLYFYRHFLYSISNFISLLNSHREAWCISNYFCRHSSLVVNPNPQTSPVALINIEKLKQNYMQLYSSFRSILHHPPPGKWVPLGYTVEGGSKNPTYSLDSDGICYAYF